MDKDGFVIPTKFRERFVVRRELNIAHAMFSDVKFTVKILELKELTDDHRKKADIGIFPDNSLVVFQYTHVVPPQNLSEEKKKEYNLHLRRQEAEQEREESGEEEKEGGERGEEEEEEEEEREPGEGEGEESEEESKEEEEERGGDEEEEVGDDIEANGGGRVEEEVQVQEEKAGEERPRDPPPSERRGKKRGRRSVEEEGSPKRAVIRVLPSSTLASASVRSPQAPVAPASFYSCGAAAASAPSSFHPRPPSLRPSHTMGGARGGNVLLTPPPSANWAGAVQVQSCRLSISSFFRKK
uniref:Uncharacterized protein n=1 Tax=Chromera velia CCMP2878 TaxID=1169474 RepID=A0A0G4EZT4_9ALVE|eukprot:Cvel_14328.t1-p1 / transcript=Cvel_14328.t1 / gene=Cvel_14328 / organism=Chromera_velia_CCMP2878 / gene_product=hypothetical protein / transcript_product=hypothetical protein / location=Cvel_scaffold1014:36713-39296(+) / protein_length=297 / sequence_SO=supercontig / SO=protein_coding / is_pseudo=false